MHASQSPGGCGWSGSRPGRPRGRGALKTAVVSTALTLGDLLRDAACEAPDAEALRYRAERLSYRAWDTLADRLAAGLWARGVRSGDVVALLLPSTPLYPVAYLAAARLGAVTTGINVRYRRTEIGHVMARAASRLVLGVTRWHDADFRAIAASLDPPPDCAWLDAEEITGGTAACVERLAAGAPAAPVAPVSPEAPAAIVFTSGTTGAPKGAWYAHRSLLALADIEARRHTGREGAPPLHLAAGLSFAHVGFMARIAVQLRTRGASLIHDTFDPAAVLETVERERLTHLGAIPTQAILLLDHPDRARRDLTSVRSVLLGGAPASPELIRRVQAELGAQVSVRYSSTEVGIATASLPDDPPEVLATTVGKPTPGVELRITGADGRALAAGEVGGVEVRSPATMRGYWNDPDATAAVLDPDGWIRTGDLGFLDESGYLHLRGRRSEMFIRGGYNVYPGEIEDLLATHPKVARAAVVGVPDPTFGEIGWAFVVAREPTDPPVLAELRAFVGAELASFKRPDRLTVLPELPVTAMFKVDKQALRALPR
jgi:acyl-CoA synthetase (AMP-forming)/AMP-acid ligase II